MADRSEYEAQAVAAARSVLLELTRLLGEYRDQIVLVGGWVPELQFPDAQPRHVGSLDIDLALDHRRFDDPGYKSVRALLESRGYEPDASQPFIFRKKVAAGGREVVVQVDLLAGEYEGTGKRNRTQEVQDVRPRKARGCDLALDLAEALTIKGTLPSGAEDMAQVRVASVVAFLVMKGMALHDRIKEKDAYDVYFCLKHYPGGVERLAQAFRPHLEHGLVKEGLAKIAEKFVSIRAFGPQAVADFEGVRDQADRDLLTRDAFERAQALLAALGIATGNS